MIAIKPGARIEGMMPEILLAITIAHHIFYVYGVDMVLTEITGGKHMMGSLHTSGLAVDIRSKNMSKEKRESVMKELKNSLGDSYDVILEDEDGPNAHIHIEFDPT